MPKISNPAPTAELLSIVEAATVLGVSRGTIYRLATAGTLKSVKLGGRRLVRRSDLQSFIESLEEVQ